MSSRVRRSRERSAFGRRSVGRRRILVALELFTGITGLAGGLLLVINPAGSLMGLEPAALQDSPFSDWLVPGVLLATLVGGGFLIAGWWQLCRWRGAPELSMLAGVGLVAFEVVEWIWIGFHPLQAIFIVVGVAVLYLAIADNARVRQ